MSYLSQSVVLVALALGAAGTACKEPGPPPKFSSSSSSSEGYASCPRATTVVGGGYEIETRARTSGHPPTVVSNHPTETGWKVECIDAEGKTVGGCRAYVLCATVL
jgi:hypothetical protein